MEDDTKRIGVLKAMLEDIADELSVVCEKEFVVEEETEIKPNLLEYFGPYYVIYDGAKAEGKEQRNSVLAVSQRVFHDTKNNIMFTPAHFFMPPDPFILEYLKEYAIAFEIDSVRYTKYY